MLHLVWLLAALFSWQAPPSPPASAPASQQGKSAQQLFEELPWPVKVGVRAHRVQDVFPLVDRVVLVPDVATYVDEIGKWSLQGRWPVLIEDDYYTPKFVRRFRPAQLIRRESVGPRELSTQAIEQVTIRVFGGTPGVQSLADAFAAHQFQPLGVVFASLDDPAWTAALALAAGHGQPIAWLDGDFGQPDGELDAAAATRLSHAITNAISTTGWSWDKLGDAIDTFTICRDIAARASTGSVEAVATIDLLGRHDDHARYAIGGWIFGSEVRSAYVAMCSLFLERKYAWLCNSYPDDGQWGLYSTTPAAHLLTEAGFEARDDAGPRATETAWLRNLMGGLTTDLVFVNSKGNSDFFDLSEGRGHPYDAPVLNTPVAVQFIHSWAMTKPANAACVGGAWIDRGAYAAIGSVHEPYLNAFVPPSTVAGRSLSLVPLLIAARWWEPGDSMSQPWRIMTYGDPLMLCASPNPPPRGTAKSRIERPLNGGVDLNDQVKDFMRQAADDGTGQSATQALRILDMLGRDDIAAQLWSTVDAAGHGSAAAKAALPALFRMRDTQQFMRAWDQLRGRDAHCQDMLWHLMWPRVSGGAKPDRDILLQLQSAVRRPVSIFDLRRLAPLLRIAFDQGHARQVIQREAEQTDLDYLRDALRQLANDI